MEGTEMESLTYPALLEPRSDGGYLVDFPDLPEAHTEGDDLQDSLLQASDCLAEALACRLDDKEPIPPPSPITPKHHAIHVPLDVAPKVALYQAMREQSVTNVALARRLNVTEAVVRRMLSPMHHTKPDRLEAALHSLGKSVSVAVNDAA